MQTTAAGPPAAPLRYHPAVESPEPDEAATGAELIATMRRISETTLKNGGHALRSVHAKSHGLLTGEMEVLADLPPVLAQGLFAQPGRYPVVLRISTVPGDLLDDSVSTPRGLALKVVGVSGERLPGSEGEVTQDFVLVNGPAFSAPSAKAFLVSLKFLAFTTDQPQALKKVASSVLRGIESLVSTFGGESTTLKALGGHPETHPLGETYYSQAPLLYGEYIAKVAVAPVSPELTELTNAPLDVNGKPNGLREAMVEFFRDTGGEWELRVQLCTDLETMPVEDPSVVWPEAKSPYVAVARISVPPQEGWSEARSRAIDDGRAFGPWQGLAAHRPLGSIMRLRKDSYVSSAQFRAERNGCPVGEPRGAADLLG